MKIITYNVNGIRSAFSKNWLGWLQATDADVICLQEIKASPDQLVDLLLLEQMGYQHYWNPAEKKGYSGTAIFTKQTPTHIEYGCGMEDYDREGRIIRVDFEECSVMSAYFPSGSSGEERQEFKFRFLDDFQAYIDKLIVDYPKLVIAGDYNICHRPIDIHNPKGNEKTSGFLPEERAWLDGFMKTGMIDTFRHLNKEPDNYSWWSYRANARNNNKGWRIDYFLVSHNIIKNVKKSKILTKVMGSDHAPIKLTLKSEGL